MKELLVILRTAQLVTHHAHNICKGSSFFQDHSFFADSYAAFEADFDSLNERMIRSGEKIKLKF